MIWDLLCSRGPLPALSPQRCFFAAGTTALYKYAASDERYQQLRGSDLVLWEGIQFFVNTGAQSLHLGRTSFDNER